MQRESVWNIWPKVEEKLEDASQEKATQKLENAEIEICLEDKKLLLERSIKI